MVVAIDYPISSVPKIVVETFYFQDDHFHTIAYDERFPEVLFFNAKTKDFSDCHSMHSDGVKFIKKKWEKKEPNKPLKVRFKLETIEEEVE
jgi:hypothetical protein